MLCWGIYIHYMKYPPVSHIPVCFILRRSKCFACMTFRAVNRSLCSRSGVAGNGSNDAHSSLNNGISLRLRVRNVTELHISFIRYPDQNSTHTIFRHFAIYRPLRVNWNKNSIQEEIKSRLKLGNACYYSVQNLLSSSLLSKKLKIYRTIILPVVLYGCETWSLTLREERRLRVFENRVLRGVFGPKRDEVTGEWRKLHNEEFSDLYYLHNIVRVVKSRRMR